MMIPLDHYVWPKLGHTFKAFIIIKTLSYILKINKRTNKNIFATAILKCAFIAISTSTKYIF